MRCLYIVFLAHRPLNVTKNDYHVSVCDNIETELDLLFHCADRAAPYNNFREILTKREFAERPR